MLACARVCCYCLLYVYIYLIDSIAFSSFIWFAAVAAGFNPFCSLRERSVRCFGHEDKKTKNLAEKFYCKYYR